MKKLIVAVSITLAIVITSGAVVMNKVKAPPVKQVAPQSSVERVKVAQVEKQADVKTQYEDVATPPAETTTHTETPAAEKTQEELWKDIFQVVIDTPVEHSRTRMRESTIAGAILMNRNAHPELYAEDSFSERIRHCVDFYDKNVIDMRIENYLFTGYCL